MSAQLVSIEALEINDLFLTAVGTVQKKFLNMDSSTLLAFREAFLDTVQGIQKVMCRTTVRGHLDPNLRNPEIHAESSWNLIFQRLKHQVKTACVLADIAHIGPEANMSEKKALDHVAQTLRNLVDKVSPPGEESDNEYESGWMSIP